MQTVAFSAKRRDTIHWSRIERTTEQHTYMYTAGDFKNDVTEDDMYIRRN